MSSGVGVSVTVPAKVKPIEKWERWWYDYLFSFLNLKVTSVITFDFSETVGVGASTSKDFEESKPVKSKLGKTFKETNPIRGFPSINFGETLPTIGTVIKSFEETVHSVISRLAIPFFKLQKVIAPINMENQTCYSITINRKTYPQVILHELNVSEPQRLNNS